MWTAGPMMGVLACDDGPGGFRRVKVDLFVRPARRACVVVIAVSSIVGGTLLAWHMIRPDSLPATSTSQLVLVAALLVLPIAALGAWYMDRVAVAQSPVGPGERE